MEVRTYRGRQLQEVMARIRAELGEEALILSTSQSRNAVSVEVGLERMPELNVDRQSSLTGTSVVARPRMVRAPLPGNIADILTGQGLEPALTAHLLQTITTAQPEKGVDRVIADGLARLFHFDSCMLGEDRRQRVVAFIGATGVGKTTTVAKLAARLRMAFDLKVGFISADAYRVGAGLQLQAYAQMLHVPCRVLSGRNTGGKELRQILADFRHLDLILIDTAGCSTSEVERIQQLQASLSAVQCIEKMLLLPAPSNTFDLHAALKAFGVLDYSRIIITKLDESGYIGPVLGAAAQSRRPLAFLTTGQKVPEDIEPASPRRLGWMLTRQIN